MVVDIFFDGACMTGGQKKDETGLGIAVYIDKLYSIEFSSFKRGDLGSNNIAEWCASVEALKTAKEITILCKGLGEKCFIRIYGDSQLIVNQFNGYWEIKHTSFVRYFTEAKQLANEINFKGFRWIPREQNRQADKLSKLALGKTTVYKDYLTID